MTQILRIASPTLMVLVIALLASRRRLIGRLVEANAHDTETAIPLAGTSPLHRMWLSRLTATDVIRSEQPGRFWLDRAAWGEYRGTRRRRGIAILLVMAAALVALLSLGVFRSQP